jgi:hypothetical protein
MNTLTKRTLLFLFFCIGTRTLFAYLAKTYTHYLPYMGALALLPAIGFFYLFFSGKRKTGAEVFGDKIWWNKLRPIHGTLYLLFAISAIRKKHYAWIFLAIDVVIGLLAFIANRIS